MDFASGVIKYSLVLEDNRLYCIIRMEGTPLDPTEWKKNIVRG